MPLKTGFYALGCISSLKHRQIDGDTMLGQGVYNP